MGSGLKSLGLDKNPNGKPPMNTSPVPPSGVKMAVVGSVVTSAATYTYSQYINAAQYVQNMGIGVTLCRALQIVDEISASPIAHDQRTWIFLHSNQLYDITVVNHQGCCHFTASYVKPTTVLGFRFKIPVLPSWVPTNMVVQALHPRYGKPCPASGRDATQKCWRR